LNIRPIDQPTVYTSTDQANLVFPAPAVPATPSADAIRSQLLDARQQATSLLAALTAQLQSQQNSGFSRVDGRPDVFRQVTGQSSIETAVADARRLVEQYDRLLVEVGGAPTANGVAHHPASTIEASPVVLRGSFRVGPATVARTG
jgi:hypothetical protein